MTELLSGLAFLAALLLYGGAGALFYLDVARVRGAAAAGARRPDLAPNLLTGAALGHAAYVALQSFVVHVCPIHSVHFLLSVASLFASALYLTLRSRFRIDPLGLLVSPLGLAFLLGTYFGKPGPEPALPGAFIALHVMANLLGLALFLLAGGAAGLYLVQERRIKEKKKSARIGNLPPLDALDTAEHRFLVAGFLLLTLGVVTGTLWARKLEQGSVEDIVRIVLGYATWLLIGTVLLLRAAAGWRGRRSAYGTIAGLVCATTVLVMYLIRPATEPRHADRGRSPETRGTQAAQGTEQVSPGGTDAERDPRALGASVVGSPVGG
jgi:ABC-type uncharacterized transport system permease subunit